VVFVVETFESLQGEGMLVGTPSFFIRTSGCNLRCAWCDTPYASWLPEGRRRRLEELLDEARKSGLEHAVVTGGEPLLQREIGALTRGLRELDLHVTVETAGTLAPSFEADLLSLSPKTRNSDPQGAWQERHRRLRRRRDCLQQLLARFPEHQLKFVIRDADDLGEVLAMVDELEGVRRSRVLLMAEGRSAAEVALRAPLVAALCLEHGFRYTPRLHLDLFAGVRGA
jgi:7-carboxy-7-deazaguanine synthase